MPYVSKYQMKGYNAAISSGAETIWNPGSTYAQLTTAVAFELVSSSASDTSAGVGARTVEVELIDGNYVKTTQTLTLNGTTVVAITGTFIACNYIKLLTAGSSLTNVGNISVRTVSGGVVKNQISSVASQVGKSNSFIYTTPKDSVNLMSSILFMASGIVDAFSVYLTTKDSNGAIFTEGSVDIGISGTAINPGKGILHFQDGLLIPEKTLVELRAIAISGAGILSASGQLLSFEKGNGII